MKVIFRKFKKEGDIIAFLPEIEASRHMTMSYQHVGQHSEADYSGLLEVTKPAKECEYNSLKVELENIYGVELQVLKKVPKAK